jgi:hypothetical protein
VAAATPAQQSGDGERPGEGQPAEAAPPATPHFGSGGVSNQLQAIGRGFL